MLDFISLDMRRNILLEQYLIDEGSRLCNCAECGRTLLSLKDFIHCKLHKPAGIELPSPVAARIKGRPYCGRCLNTAVNS